MPASSAPPQDREIVERHELKYLVPERYAPAIREAARAHCTVDRYAGPDGRYPIRSLYFDTRGLHLYWANDREQADRFKVRARTYPAANAPVFLEVKRRVGDHIIKTRAPVPSGSWAAMVRDPRRAAPCADAGPMARRHLDTFLRVVGLYHLEPILLIEYEREAYESPRYDYCRLTLDRHVRTQAAERLDLAADPRRWVGMDHPARTNTAEPAAVLELKFGHAAPLWMMALVRRLDLLRAAVSKYCYGLEALRVRPEPRTPARSSWD